MVNESAFARTALHATSLPVTIMIESARERWTQNGLPICAIARHEACGWREWLVSISGYSSRACKADEPERMCRLVEAAAVLPPAPAGRSRWRIISIASARHRRSPHKSWQKTHTLSLPWCHLLTPLWREQQLQRRSGSNGRSTACMNNMHLCGWTLDAKPVSSVSREADATVVKSMVSAECKKAKSLAKLARNSHKERDR